MEDNSYCYNMIEPYTYVGCVYTWLTVRAYILFSYIVYQLLDPQKSCTNH